MLITPEKEAIEILLSMSHKLYIGKAGHKSPGEVEGFKDTPGRQKPELFAAIDRGCNVIMLTDGLAVVDDDTAKHGGVLNHGLDFPSTWTVRTPSGSRHYYYRLPAGVKCPSTTSQIAPHVDTRGEGGYVVLPPSQTIEIVSDTGKIQQYAGQYVWEGGPHNRYCAVAPEWLVQWCIQYWAKKETKKQAYGPQEPATPTPEPATGSDVDKLLKKCVADVVAADPGTRRNTLNKAAYYIAGRIDTQEITRVADVLVRAGVATGLPADEAHRTVQEGLADGLKHPLPPPVSIRSGGPSDKKQEADLPPDGVFPPGFTYLPDDSTSQPPHIFTRQILDRFPQGRIYSYHGDIITIEDGEAVTVDPYRFIGLYGKYGTVIQARNDGRKSVYLPRPISLEESRLVMSNARGSDTTGCPEITRICDYPVLYRDDDGAIHLAQPGINPGGIFYAGKPVVHGDAQHGVKHLAAVLADFPWSDKASKTNYIAALLTPMVSGLISGTSPLFLYGAPQPRSGKTMLAMTVAGGILRGKDVAGVMCGRIEEVEKTIDSLLLQGRDYFCLDNLPDAEVLTSAKLAGLVTAGEVIIRPMHTHTVKNITHKCTIYATGNNVGMSTELAARSVPILLHAPQQGRKFAIRDIRAYIAEHRADMVSALIRMVEVWRDAGCPDYTGPQTLLGFEGWVNTVGGILEATGQGGSFLANLEEFTETKDSEGEIHAALMDALGQHYSGREITALDAKAILVAAGICPEGVTIKGVGRVLSRYVDRPLAGRKLTKRRGMNGMLYGIEEYDTMTTD